MNKRFDTESELRGGGCGCPAAQKPGWTFSPSIPVTHKTSARFAFCAEEAASLLSRTGRAMSGFASPGHFATRTMEARMAINANAAEILLYGPIDTEAATDFDRTLRARSGPVTVRVNSPGGDVFAGASIHAMIARHGKVTVLVDGLAASAASYLAMAAARVVMAENAMMMIHNPAAMTAGESSDHQRTAVLLNGIRDQMVRAYSGKAGIPPRRSPR